jgi:hypothetical protein
MQISKEKRMTESLCDDNKFYDHICQVILFSLYFNKHISILKDLRNIVDDALRLQSPLDDDTWKACMKILNDKGLIATWS